MKIITAVASLTCIALLYAAPLYASDTDDLTNMLEDFLSHSSDEATHAKFWAEELIYTSSAGLRFGKADIMAGFEGSESEDEAADEAPSIVYSGQDVDIRIYGNTAIVAFKLVGIPTDKTAASDVLYYFNTGTFLKRDGVWEVVAWQATKIPPQ